MKKFTSEEIKEFISKPFFDEQVILNKDTSWPKISIVTPSYNQADFLERTILSVLNQNYPNLEYIIIDGGSTDGSVEIIKKYEKYLAYWVSEKDKGQSDAINKGFKVATGDIIAWQNSDDIYLPEAFSQVAKVIMSDGNIKLLYGDMLRINSDDDVRDIQINTEVQLWMQLEHNQIQNQAALWKRQLLEENGYLDEQLCFCLDYEYFTRLLKMGIHYVKIDRLLGAQRFHAGCKTAQIQTIHDSEKLAIVRKYGGVSKGILPKWLLGLLVKLYKAGWHFRHGNVWYMLRKF